MTRRLERLSLLKQPRGKISAIGGSGEDGASALSALCEQKQIKHAKAD